MNSAGLTTSELLDIQVRLTSRAWAFQIMVAQSVYWQLHLLPTVPFDMRALVYACNRIRDRRTSQARIYQKLASMDSHLSCILLGIGLTCMVFQLNFTSVITGWYGFIAAAVYLFVGGRWKAARLQSSTNRPTKSPPTCVDAIPLMHVNPTLPSGSLRVSPHGAHYAMQDSDVIPALDIDEILRKLHREGESSLSDDERQAL